MKAEEIGAMDRHLLEVVIAGMLAGDCRPLLESSKLCLSYG